MSGTLSALVSELYANAPRPHQRCAQRRVTMHIHTYAYNKEALQRGINTRDEVSVLSVSVSSLLILAAPFLLLQVTCRGLDSRLCGIPYALALWVPQKPSDYGNPYSSYPTSCPLERGMLSNVGGSTCNARLQFESPPLEC